jgi:hypothetical protein
MLSADKVLRVLSQDRPCGSVVEHPLGKGEIAGPIPAKGTSLFEQEF